MKYVVEVTNGTEDRVCEVTNLYDRFAKPTLDPANAVSGVLRLDANHFLDFDPTTVDLHTVH